MKPTLLVPVLLGIACAVIAAVSWHSVEEIHYLKRFFPSSFTVEQAYYASRIELIKVMLISWPLVFAAVVALIWARKGP